MLVNMKEMLQDAERNHYAIASINTPNLETLQAVVSAAEALDAPITINHAQGHEDTVRMETIAPLMAEYARNAKVPVCMHIDHGHDIHFCMRALRQGFTSIMYDRSDLPIDDNIAEIKRFMALVEPLDITVEAELGEMPNNMPTCIPGQEKSDLSDLSIYFTDPDEAIRFCEETHVDALAISVGTVHGMYESEPNLDIERIKKIKAGITGTALCLHGGSGVDPAQLNRAVKAGIRKINYFTGMDTCVAPELLKTLQAADGAPVNYSNIVNQARELMKQNAMRAIESMQ